ncbi:AI-2E family transporter [Photobacterium damselae subsp. damselae]|uniref:AI-2E family transporter n=1 Tax=Photobacterium damselae TaxID=38293 RepID=UPI000839F08D|nr:AI-2E family transporter [Photobacterium damselae]MCG3814779.1 AI-2E family transporter [Photobacterium damselae]QSH55986.1 AI-2E family transporter [Photobacterium damselae subsp. damselae]UKA03022.1 AI-2E family transporter [Photobacterium damselae subsp. damselae]UKA26581.1 AI-2E family transporter [Photobacterium damselae subsp. damselae]UKA30391.1 AI-2E family transporter [Photobacterium damselae subsp. damselae]
MDKQMEQRQNKLFVNNMVESAIRIGLLLVLIIWTYDIVKPFIIPVLWGAIIAVALMPLTDKLQAVFKGRRGLAATVIALVCIALLIAPFVMVSGSIYDGITHTMSVLQSGDIKIPGPTQRIADIPVVGDKIYEVWSLFATNMEKAVTNFLPEIKTAVGTLASILGSSLASLVVFIIALAVAGGFMTHSHKITEAIQKVSIRTVGKNGAKWTTLTAATIRSVLLGVVGVAFIQAMIIGSAMFAFHVPMAGLLTLGVLILCIAQLPALIVVAPVIFYVYSTGDGTSTTIFTIWALAGGLADNILKPMLMGRGVDVPMPVILIGAIGGMLFSGIIGLFLGAVILAIWYELFMAWLKADAETTQAVVEETQCEKEAKEQ